VTSVSLASWILAGYWAALMLSRGILSRVALGADPYRILLFCALGACAGALVAGMAPSAGVAAPGIALCGFSLAGIFPAALGIAGARFPRHSGTVFGILFAVGLSGGMMLPWAAGLLGDAAGLRWVFGMVAAAFAAILGLSRVAARLDPGIGKPVEEQ
jgi:fucose permease